VTKDDSESGNSPYVAWKGWVDETPFGRIDAGETKYFDSELREITAHGAAISEVLEIGFGNGSFLAYCAARGWNVVGTEQDTELLRIGTASGFTVHPADYLSSLPDRSFDLIAMFDVLEHIPQDAMVDFLSTLEHKIRVGGAILFRFPNSDSWIGNPLQNGDPTHVTAIGYLKMTYFALQADLEIRRFRGTRRKGFSSSFIHGLYALIAGPIIAVSASIKRALYFPGLPVVLTTSNVVCIVGTRNTV
jgi:2-polyprenyl-3-methyl-5-hydroxy-6-metoxy-1,4-benzoquinol methylase